MKYARHGKTIKKTKTVTTKNIKRIYVQRIGLVSIALSVLLGGFFFFKTNTSAENAGDMADNEAMEIFGEDNIEVTGQKNGGVEQITLQYKGEEEGAFSGTAKRGTEHQLFSHVIVADLPDIDTSLYRYEGWLVKPGVTEFFSTGNLVRRSDGKWSLVWEMDKGKSRIQVNDYTMVIVTQEEIDGTDGPSTHVLEGDFSR